MIFKSTTIPDVIVITPQAHEDSRGTFFEFYNQEVFKKNGIGVTFLQDNHSISKKGVLRGLHFQRGAKAQAKLVRVLRGKIFDVTVDVRHGSATFGKHVGEILSAENKKMLFIPAGFAHGFCALEDNTEVLYKVSQIYSASDENGILWNDPALEISWPKLDMEYILSDRDKKYPGIESYR